MRIRKIVITKKAKKLRFLRAPVGRRGGERPPEQPGLSTINEKREGSMKTSHDPICHKHVKYIIPGAPIALQRPRFGRGNVYDSQKEIRMISEISLRNQHEDTPMFTGPIHLEINFYLPYGSVKSKSKEGLPHIQRPDISNLIKYIEDVMTGIVYPDDKLVAAITSYKWFSCKPRTEIIVSEILL